MNYILFDENNVRNNLLPLTFMRPVADIRVGILTIREKWEKRLQTSTSTLTDAYLSRKFPIIKEDINVLLNGSVCPTDQVAEMVMNLKPNQTLVSGDTIIALHVTASELDHPGEPSQEGIEEIHIEEPLLKIAHVWDIFVKNGEALDQDFEVLTRNRNSEPPGRSNLLIGGEKLFIEPGAVVEGATINTTAGPVYIGENAEIMEGSHIRGPLALCDHATIKMGAKIYGPTTIGPYSKVGGEVNNSVIFGYSNKAHDGFIGHSVIAEWCNLGADTNTSNLKNTYDQVRLWSYPKKTFVNTHLQFCGLIMGDHSKCGINTMFNTGTVVGLNANIFGPGFQRNFIPSFTWGGTSGHSSYDLAKAFEVAQAVCKRRGVVFSDLDKEIMAHIYQVTMQNKYL
jgi:UDP-N-acetylglucosamine diphosphorylase/glucosamine-1-phosphate N-acetyltransferase